MENEKFKKYLQKVLEDSIGERYTRDSLNKILEIIFNSLTDYLINQEDNYINLDIGKLSIKEEDEEIKLIFNSVKGKDEIKNEYYFMSGGGIDSDDLGVIFEDDGEYEPEEDEIGNVNFNKEEDNDDMDISGFLDEEF